MKIAIKFFLVIVLLGTSLYGYGENTNAQQVVDKMIQAYGGEKNLKQLNNYEQFWKIEAKTTNKNGTDNRKVKMPSYLYTNLQYPHKSEIRELQNNQGTKQFGQKIIKAQGPMLDAMKLQLMRLYNPLQLKNSIKHLVLVADQKYYILSLSQNGVTADYYVSKHSYLIQKVVGKLQMGAHKMEFLTFYEDYKRVGGVMIPHREIKYAGSVNTAIMHLQKTTFAQPASGFIRFKI